ncbi:hypothetical protein [Streptomyces corynorhini]|uniref:PE-PGRS family protein n=1 Tax=Streptomyces corynorhini TaxID=2282652 RepID=A0A370BAY5_9ACTN|nr:hypothetical protein [Streptomyces corynorhini]RDG37802.1 hypothetical protein DVH02_12485 [Streptomyces corynorhini]
MTAGPVTRMLRAVLFAAVCVVLAAVGHVWMSGSALPWWALSLAFVATVSAAWAAACRERACSTVTGAVVVAQAALHTGFSLAQALTPSHGSGGVSFARRWLGHLTCGVSAPYGMSGGDAEYLVHAAGSGSAAPAAPPGMPHGAMEGLGHAGHLMSAGADSSAAMAHGPAGVSPAGMLLAHLVAAVLCGVWLAHGERAAFRLLRTFGGWVLAPLRVPLTPPVPCGPPRVCLRGTGTPRRPRRFLLTHSLVSRGPPVVAAVS